MVPIGWGHFPNANDNADADASGAEKVRERPKMKLITKLRKAMGLTQSRLAARAGLHPSQISLFESERMKPSDSQLRKMAKPLGVPADRAHTLLDEVRSDEGPTNDAA
jgi:transcriptional regulator with XRE-family HTH domain